MKIAVAQTRPVTGDIPRNILRHQHLIDLAARNGADVIIFPELSLTGYEPVMAQSLAMEPEDESLDVFQAISDARQMTIGVGLPTRHRAGICISMVLFQPGKTRRLYSKRYLHPDEEPFFVSGQGSAGLVGEDGQIALAICYELSVPAHAEEAFHAGARYYAASVAKFARGMDQAVQRLAEIAKCYSMMVLISNSVGPADDGICAGRSSVWNKEGVLLGQLDEESEGLLIADTVKEEAMRIYIQLKNNYLG